VTFPNLKMSSMTTKSKIFFKLLKSVERTYAGILMQKFNHRVD